MNKMDKELETKFTEIDKRFLSFEFKLDALWDYNIRRARSETLYKGFGKEESPLVINDDIKKIYERYLPELKTYYEKISGHLLTYKELFILIDQEFGERFVREVCVPYNMASGACIDIACTLCKESGDD